MKEKFKNYNEIQAFYDDNHTIVETAAHFGISKPTLERYIKKGLLKSRNLSESCKLRAKLKPRTHTDEVKARLREHMVRRLAEGTYPTLGRSNRLINEPSYPEKFFAGVIQREFTDSNVVAEMPFGIYSLDFAWPHLKRCIEIDGEQHFASEEAIARDARKDAYLTEQGWKVLRIRWKDCFKDPSYYIQLAKQFIDG